MTCYAWPARSNSDGCQQPALCALSKWAIDPSADPTLSVRQCAGMECTGLHSCALKVSRVSNDSNTVRVSDSKILGHYCGIVLRATSGSVSIFWETQNPHESTTYSKGSAELRDIVIKRKAPQKAAGDQRNGATNGDTHRVRWDGITFSEVI